MYTILKERKASCTDDVEVDVFIRIHGFNSALDL